MTNKKHMNYLLPKQHIRTTDMRGKVVALTVNGHGLQKVFDVGLKEYIEKGVLYFDETEKYLIMNKARLDNMAEILGSEYPDDWQGKKVALYVEKVKAFGKLQDAIRIRKPAPAQQKDLPVSEKVQCGELPLHVKEAYWTFANECGLDQETAGDILQECGMDWDRAMQVLKDQHYAPDIPPKERA